MGVTTRRVRVSVFMINLDRSKFLLTTMLILLKIVTVKIVKMRSSLSPSNKKPS